MALISSINDKGGEVTEVSTSSYTLTNTDYIILVTSDTTLTLGEIATIGQRQSYKIFTENATATVECNASDTISGAGSGGNSSYDMSEYSMMTVRALTSTKWFIGD